MAVSESDWDNSIQVLVDEREENISDTDARTTTSSNFQSSMRQITLAFPKLPRNNVRESSHKANISAGYCMNEFITHKDGGLLFCSVF